MKARAESNASRQSAATRSNPQRSSAFLSLSLAILRGFLRDKGSVFFAVLLPLMFLVLFGGTPAWQQIVSRLLPLRWLNEGCWT